LIRNEPPTRLEDAVHRYRLKRSAFIPFPEHFVANAGSYLHCRQLHVVTCMCPWAFFRPRLHEQDRRLRCGRRKAGNDLACSCASRTRHCILRYGAALRAVRQRRSSDGSRPQRGRTAWSVRRSNLIRSGKLSECKRNRVSRSSLYLNLSMHGRSSFFSLNGSGDPCGLG
jgi:hypothetical protein